MKPTSSSPGPGRRLTEKNRRLQMRDLYRRLASLVSRENTLESRNLLALAQGIRATPWQIEESDDEVNEADLQATLEASKKADNVVPFSSSGTVSLPVSFSPSLVSSLPSAVVCSNMPSSSAEAGRRATAASGGVQRYLLFRTAVTERLGGTDVPVVFPRSVNKEWRTYLWFDATAAATGSGVAGASGDIPVPAATAGVAPIPLLGKQEAAENVCCCIPRRVCSIKSSLCVDFADVRARVLSTQSILTSLKSTVVRMEKVLLDDKKLLQSFEAGDVGSDSAPAR
nr:transcription factor bHLH36-like isoform X2 [Ipomoea batatas]